jgi:hypothetical protein
VRGVNCLRSLEHWDHGFETHAGHGCLYVCVYSTFVLFYVYEAALRRSDHSSKESYRLCKIDHKIEDDVRAQQRAVEPLMNELVILLHSQ